MRQEIIHYGLLDNLYRFFPRTVTIKEFTPGTQDTYGEITVGTWEDVTGLIDLPCQISAASGGEQKRTNMTPVIYDYRIVIAGDYPEILEAYRAVMDDDVALDVVLVEHDTQNVTTPLLAKLVRN